VVVTTGTVAICSYFSYNNYIMIHTLCESCGAVRNFGGLAGLQRKLNTGLCRDCWKKNAVRGADNPRWKGGVTYNFGYRLIFKPDHPYADRHGYVREHRLVVEKRIGRYLRREEIVHHDNHVRTDNRDENLVITDVSTHARQLHGKKKGLCYVCGAPQIGHNLCRQHIWSYYTKEHRKTSGYNQRRNERERRRRMEKEQP